MSPVATVQRSQVSTDRRRLESQSERLCVLEGGGVHPPGSRTLPAGMSPKSFKA